MMANNLKSVPKSIFRFATNSPVKSPNRALSSIIPDNKFEDFQVKNEPVYGYENGSKERRILEAALKERYNSDIPEIPIVIGGEEYRTDKVVYQVMPHDHSRKIAKFYYATPELIQKAIDVSVKAQKEWDRVPFDDRFKMWLKAADIMAGPARQKLNAATMVGQAKTIIQAEIDSAAELVDFFRFNALYAKEILKYQPISENLKVTKNSIRYRGLEGFIAAVSPFNFTAIGGNLAYTPALMGNAVLWKPSDTAILSNWTIFKIMKDLGLPPGVVNFVPAFGPTFGDVITKSPHFAGVNFTGSVPTFRHLWQQTGANLPAYRNFPRLIGECGGKNFHFVHPSSDVQSVVYATIRSAFEYSGQKCSACSRLFVPKSLSGQIKDGLIGLMKELKLGPVNDFSSFTSAVIDEKSFDRNASYIDHAKANLKILSGGTYSKKEGYYITPTLIETEDPMDKIMREEIFGPVLTMYAYEDSKVDETLELIDSSTPYALTGAIFSQDENFLKSATEKLKYASGNFYINDRSTGSVVAQQPFGGGRLSGTNDKAGSPHYVLRWSTPQAIKETFVPTREWKYPYMEK